MNQEKTTVPKALKFTELLPASVLGILYFVFFSFFYENHLRFTEQLQLFLLTGNYFTGKLMLPGGFNSWTGGILTQFYHIPVTGALIIAILLVTIQLLTRRIILKFSIPGKISILSLLPALLAGFILCNELFPLSAITGFAGSLAATLIYTGIKNTRWRPVTGFVLIPLVYVLLGGAYLAMVVLMTAFELIPAKAPDKTEKNLNSSGTIRINKLKPWLTILYIPAAAAIPLLFRHFFVFQPLRQSFLTEFYHNIPDKIPVVIPVLFALPSVIVILYSLIPQKYLKNKYCIIAQILIILGTGIYGYNKWVNFDAERTMTYDQLVRNQKWEKVISFAGKKPPGNYLSLAMLNLSLAKTGQLGDKMFNYSQHGTEGLFLRFDKEFISPMMGNEILYHLGLVNASQEYAFESMEVMPNMEKSVRAIKKLAETNLINGHYRVSEKYLKLLEKTLFYRKWAKKTRGYLFNEEMINDHPDWGEKRKFMIKEDFFFHIEDIEIILQKLVRENPSNRIALEYLAATYLLKREMDAFADLLPIMEKMNYSELPVSYQEAFILYRMVTNRDPLAGSSFRISQNIRSAMDAYAKVYLSNKDARNLLSRFYSGTYWYYFHYAE